MDKPEEDGEPEAKQEAKEQRTEKREKDKELPLTEEPTFDEFLDIVEIFWLASSHMQTYVSTS